MAEGAIEREVRKRKAPPWNPRVPYRSLQHTFIAALSGCKEISIRDLEVVLARGKVAMTGTRSDRPGDLVPDRIEQVVAAANGLVFSFENSIISASYLGLHEQPGRVVLLSEVLYPYPPGITFDKVLVHWPNLVDALHELGFDIIIDGNSDKEMKFVCWMESEKHIHGTYPPRDHSRNRPERIHYRAWAAQNGVSRKTVEDWVRTHNLKEATGAPKRNSAKK
jgi:hypothetical protein